MPDNYSDKGVDAGTFEPQTVFSFDKCGFCGSPVPHADFSRVCGNCGG